jgi:hypothetical protein
VPFPLTFGFFLRGVWLGLSLTFGLEATYVKMLYHIATISSQGKKAKAKVPIFRLFNLWAISQNLTLKISPIKQLLNIKARNQSSKITY